VGAFLNLPKERYAYDKHKDRDALLTPYDFPAEHWNHLRAPNPIESVFATVQHRSVCIKDALS